MQQNVKFMNEIGSKTLKLEWRFKLINAWDVIFQWSQLDLISFFLAAESATHSWRSVISIFRVHWSGRKIKGQSSPFGEWRSRVSRRLGRPSEGLYKASCVIIIWQAWRIWDQNTRLYYYQMHLMWIDCD